VSAFRGLAQAWKTRMPDPELSKLERFDVSKPLVVYDAMSTVAMPTTPMKFGVGGDPIELHQNLYACLRVGRLDRASAILKRLADIYHPEAPEVIDAHNIYLQALFEHAEQNTSEQALQNIEQWHQENMVASGITSNAQTIVTLLRVALSYTDKDRQEDAVQRYLAMAQEAGPAVLEDVNASPDFSDEQWDTLIRLQSHSYEEPPPVEEVQESQFATPAGMELAIEHGFLPDPALTIKPVEQKGLGLSSLKAALNLFEPNSEEVPYPHDMDAPQEVKDRTYAYMRQIRVEQDAQKAATERWKAEDVKLQEMGIHGVLQSKPIQALMWDWYSALETVLQAEIDKTKEVLSNPSEDNMRDDRHKYGPFLEGLSAKFLAATALSRTLAAIAGSQKRDNETPGNEIKLVALAMYLGRDIELHYNDDAKKRYINLMRKTRMKNRQELLAKLSKGETPVPAHSPEDAKKTYLKDTFKQKEFPSHVKVHLGVLVLDALMQSAKITVTREDPKTGKTLTLTQPAFHHHTSFQNGKKIVFVTAHHEILQKLANESVHTIQNIKLPMLVEPKPWTSFEDGGYYTLRDQAVRTKPGDSVQKTYSQAAIDNGDMKKVLAGLDVLGKVPWKVNRAVFEVMAKAWNSGEGIGSLVPGDTKLERPAELGPEASHQQRMDYAVAMREYKNKKDGLHSQRCFQNFQLEVARSFLNEKFYYPHSVDFRGRAYPIPPVLNHIGSDVSRGLLMFANGKELGEVGLQWLKIQLANLYGFDKASLKDREQFAMDNIEDVYDSANNPLTGKRWWLKADDPWQCLACCIELKNALESPDPTRFVSHLPVHQDGTCNGLQHYAALGGDEAGASQVNLEPSDKPQDIYTGVAEIVKEMIAEDAKNGHTHGTMLDGKITRTVVKRTVMTNVYGVTFIGARAQVEDELRDIFPSSEVNSTTLNLLATYTVRKIFLALGRIFNGAQDIQCWLGECGDRITTSLTAEQVQKLKDHYDGKELGLEEKYKGKNAKVGAPRGLKPSRVATKIQKDIQSFKTSIIWTTPLKMPVVQPYRKDRVQVVKTRVGFVSVARSADTDEVNKRKQLQAFPPNFIHSLDATHMILSALKCAELGMDFAAVHDSFWTHAADIPNLNVVLRDAFVRMHSEDIIGRLRAEFEARYGGGMYLAKLAYDTPVAKEIIALRGNNSRGGIHIQELAQEAKRQALLRSDDPEERKKGEEMVTPTSIWLKYSDPTSLASSRLALLGEKNMNRGTKVQTAQKKKQAALKEAEAAAIKANAPELSVASIDVENTSVVDEEMNTDDKDLADAVADVEAKIAADEEPLSEEEQAEMEDLKSQMTEEERDAYVKTQRRQISLTMVKVWLPLTFPPVPKRGSWDVKRLHESKYFFS
jgi:DNA-directed RNA polymerase